MNTPNYTFEMTRLPGEDIEAYGVEAVKHWQGGQQRLRLYTTDFDEAATDQLERLHILHESAGLQSAMLEAERLAVKEWTLPADRADARLFTEGPPDPFTTQRAQELDRMDNHYFRVGAPLDEGEDMTNRLSLNMVRISSSEDDQPHFEARELARMEAAYAPYLHEVAGIFNFTLAEAAPEEIERAAVCWANELSLPVGPWRETTAAQLDFCPLPEVSTPRPTPPLELDF
jgi:hypothetical protein